MMHLRDDAHVRQSFDSIIADRAQGIWVDPNRYWFRLVVTDERVVAVCGYGFFTDYGFLAAYLDVEVARTSKNPDQYIDENL